MNVLAYFSDNGIPATGLITPTIRIRDVDTTTLLINGEAMSEVGDGFYVYDFISYDKYKDYSIVCDGTSALNDADRYVYAGNENYIDDIDSSLSDSTSAVAEAVWSEETSGYTDPDTFGGHLSSLSAASVQEIVDGVWDEPLTGANHNIPTTSGRRLRQLSSIAISEGLAEGYGNGYNQIQLDVDSFTTDGAYDPSMIAITEGTGAGQCRNIFEYDTTTRIATVDRNWKIQPDATSYYIIYSDPGREHVNEGLARGGTEYTITLNEYSASADDLYVGQTIFIRSGHGEDQSCIVQAYDGTTKIATMEKAWKIIPDTTSAYIMMPNRLWPREDIAETVWDEPLVKHTNDATTGFALMHESYDDTVFVDPISGSVGEYLYPAGIRQHPVSSVSDALQVIDNYNLSKIHIMGTVVVSSGENVDDLSFTADNSTFNFLDIHPGVSTNNTLFENLSIVGTFDGRIRFTYCVLFELFNVDGGIKNSLIVDTIHFKDDTICYMTDTDAYVVSGGHVTHGSRYKEIDVGASVLNMIRCAGHFKITNKTANNVTQIGMEHGDLWIDSTCVDGIIHIDGVTALLDESGPNCDVQHEDRVHAQEFTEAAWSETASGYTDIETFGGLINNINDNTELNQEYLQRIVGLVHENIFIDNPIYDGDNNLTSARLRIYSDSVSVGTDNNVIGTYQISAPSDGPGRFINWQQVKV